MFNQFFKRQNLTIFAINIAGNALYFYFSLVILYLLLLYYKLIVNNYVAFILGDIIELYAMRKESGIYKYCLIEKATILLYITFLSIIYLLIYALMILRMAVTCTIHKILYNSNSENSKHSFSEMVVMVSTSKNS